MPLEVKVGRWPRFMTAGVKGEIASDAGFDEVDAAGGEELFDGGEIGGGEAEEAAAFLAVADGADDGVGAAEEPGGFLEFSLEDGFADASAADGDAVEEDGRDGVDLEIEGGGEFGEGGWRCLRGCGRRTSFRRWRPVGGSGKMRFISRTKSAAESSRRVSSNLTATTATAPWARR